MASDVAASCCGPTRPPVRLRMTSADLFCARSMEVEWEEGTGERLAWSSWTEELESSFEAAKILPSGAVAICVKFKVQGPGGPWDVSQVDRHNKCQWKRSPLGEFTPEVIWLRAGPEESQVEVDAVFELKGPAQGCYVSSAINTARQGSPEWWECWDNDETRPPPEERAATLDAADGAAPLVGMGIPQVYYKCTAKRMCAALHVLLEIHRATIAGLRELDKRFTGQWVGVNSANTAAAGMGIAAAVLLFTVPPVGVGLGIGSAIAGSVGCAGDFAADYAHFKGLRRQLAKDAWNAFIVSELTNEWMEAQQALGASNSAAGMLQSQRAQPRSAAAQVEELVGAPVDAAMTAGAVSQGTAATATRVVERVANVGPGAAVAGQVFGIAGALVSTGIAIRGWSSTKSGQRVVRDQIGSIGLRMVQIQHLLAAVDRLECPICSDDITHMDDVRRCKHAHHCFHARCCPELPFQTSTDASQQAPQKQRCPCCSSSMRPGVEALVDSVQNFQKSCAPPPTAQELVAREFLRFRNEALRTQRNMQRAIATTMQQQLRASSAPSGRRALTNGRNSTTVDAGSGSVTGIV
mmetsp:Transcript_25159/g.49278  ORF Transcript_25159/g.49278 Transcript_25159/m.49278 type:complete len:580 (-) Transcript_25159:255-1994(-)